MILRRSISAHTNTGRSQALYWGLFCFIAGEQNLRHWLIPIQRLMPWACSVINRQAMGISDRPP